VHATPAAFSLFGKKASLCLQHEKDGRILRRHWYTLSEHQLKSMRLSFPLVLPSLYMMISRVKRFCGSPSFSRIPPRARLPNSEISYANDNIEALSLSGMTGPLRSNDQEHSFTQSRKARKVHKEQQGLILGAPLRLSAP
jgi:hypothetical protein